MEWLANIAINRYGSAFLGKLRNIANYLGCSPYYLLAVMWSESRLNHLAGNPYGGAFGLIQFIPSTQLALGFTQAQLKNVMVQLDAVKAYYSPIRGKIKSFGDLYLYTYCQTGFYNNNFVCNTGKDAYYHCKGFAKNGQCTGNDFKRYAEWLYRNYARGIAEPSTGAKAGVVNRLQVKDDLFVFFAIGAVLLFNLIKSNDKTGNNDI